MPVTIHMCVNLMPVRRCAGKIEIMIKNGPSLKLHQMQQVNVSLQPIIVLQGRLGGGREGRGVRGEKRISRCARLAGKHNHHHPPCHLTPHPHSQD